MSIEVAISNVKMANDAFGGNLELVKLALAELARIETVVRVKVVRGSPKPKTPEAPKIPEAPKAKPPKAKPPEAKPPEAKPPEPVVVDEPVKFDVIEDSTPTHSDVKKALIKLATTGPENRAKAHEILKDIGGVSKVADVAEEKLAEVLKAVQDATC